MENRGGNFLPAIGFFQRLLIEYPNSIHHALAQKRIAEIYEMGLGDTSKAFEAYEKVLLNYPNSLYLEEVRQKLRQIRGSLP